MTDELPKKQTILKPLKNDLENGHVLPLRPTKSGLNDPDRLLQEAEKIDFSVLAQKLEYRIGQIESNVKDSFKLLEKDIQKIIKSKGQQTDEGVLKTELEGLSHKLEQRFNKTLTLLAEKEATTKKEKENLKMIKRLTSQLVKILTFDFYKSVIGTLGHTEYEEEIDPFGMDRHLVSKIKPIFDFLYFKYWRVTTTGIENIPSEERGLIVSNHSGTVPYDGAMIKTAILNEHAKRTDARFLVEDFVYHMPILGTFMYRIGGVRACQENADRLLKEGHLVIVFPEGVKGIGKLYDQRYKLQRFGRGGFIKLCMNAKSPLIPVAVVGAEEIHPIIFKSNILAKTIGVPYIPITPTFPLLGLLGCVPYPTKWSIHFGEPMTFSNYGAEALEDELLIHKLTEKVRSKIQGMIFNLLKKRRSVWTG